MPHDIGQTYLENLNNPERRAELLSPEMIIGAGFSRAGWTALLVPPAATLADVAGYDQMFNHRYSGLQASLLSFDQNPTSQLIGAGLGLAGNVLVDPLANNEGFDRSEAARNTLTILPFNRVLGVKNALHAVEE